MSYLHLQRLHYYTHHILQTKDYTFVWFPKDNFSVVYCRLLVAMNFVFLTRLHGIYPMPHLHSPMMNHAGLYFYISYLFWEKRKKLTDGDIFVIFG